MVLVLVNYDNSGKHVFVEAERLLESCAQCSDRRGCQSAAQRQTAPAGRVFQTQHHTHL